MNIAKKTIKGRYDRINLVERYIKKYYHNVGKNCRILDVGCGEGLFDNISNIDYYGIEIDDSRANKAKNKGIKIINCDLNHINRLPFDDTFFDIVIVYHVLEHVLNPKLLLEELYRVMKKNGYMFVSIPNCGWIINRLVHLLKGKVEINYNPYEIWKKHIHFYRFNEQKLLLESLFRIEEIYYVKSRLIPLNGILLQIHPTLFSASFDYILKKV